MAQTGYTPILIYASGTTGNTPSASNLTSSASGAELALNYFDGKLFYKDASGTVQVLATKGGVGSSTNTQVLYNSSGLVVGSSNLTFNGTSLTLGGNPTLSAGTANGVAYLNGSKVLTSGSALVFDGASLGLGLTPSTVAGTWQAIELVNAGNCLVGGYGEIDLANNLKYDRAGGFSFVNTGYASRFVQIGGQYLWYSGTGTAGANAGSAMNQHMILNTSGQLGLGATSPSYQLDIGNGTTVTNRIRLQRGSDDANQYMTLGWSSISVYRADTSLSSAQTSLSFNQIGSDGTRTPLFISSAGYIGVNQTSPGYRFQITGGSDIASSSMQLTVNANVANQISLSNGFANRSGLVFLGDGSSGNTSFGVISTQQALLFSTAAYNVSGISNLSTGWTERARFDASGSFGVGETNPGAYGKLAVYGSTVCTNPNYYSTFINANYSASGFWQAAVGVPNDGVSRWIPIVGGAAVTLTQGYVTQAIFGVKKSSSASFAVGAYIGVTASSDSGPGREFLFDTGGNFSAPGTKSFRIPHPLSEKAETHELWHVALEGPNLDLIYRGTVDLVAGVAEVNIDTIARMSEGTFVALTKDAQAFTSNESDWTPVRGAVNGNILSVEAQDNTATSKVSWMVIAKRKDENATNEMTTDQNGEYITERLAG